MDLISRKSVAKKMLYRRDYVGRPSDPDCIIADEPSVPAVPLDELCEFLGGAVTPCILLNIGCPYNDANRGDCDSCRAREAWKITLSKWMEEQDAIT